MYYTLEFAAFFDPFYDTGYITTDDISGTPKKPGQCGYPGVRAGLQALFQSQTLNRIPFGSIVEIPMGLYNTYAGDGSPNLCLDYEQVQMRIIATCEYPSPSHSVYQYATSLDRSTGKIDVQYDQRVYALNSTATFSVHWPKPARKLLDETLPDRAELENILETMSSFQKSNNKETIEALNAQNKLTYYMLVKLSYQQV